MPAMRGRMHVPPSAPMVTALQSSATWRTTTWPGGPAAVRAWKLPSRMSELTQ
jgi:hypothetical protein